MAALPAWVGTGAVVGMEGGRDAVLNTTAALLAARVPVAAVWLQDWTGVRHLAGGDRLWWNWESDDVTYPDWGGMVAGLRAEHGVRVLSYVNPFLVNATAKVDPATGAPAFRRNLLQEASDRGYLVQRGAAAGGGDYILKAGSFDFGTVDLSSAAAADWFTRVLVDNMLLPGAGGGNATGGVSGWMHDFGEYVYSLLYGCILALSRSSTYTLAHSLLYRLQTHPPGTFRSTRRWPRASRRRSGTTATPRRGRSWGATRLRWRAAPPPTRRRSSCGPPGRAARGTRRSSGRATSCPPGTQRTG